MSIADKITQLTNIRAAIRTALINKGVAAAAHDFADFAADIASIPTSFSLQSKTISPSTSQQTVRPDSGYDGLSQVTVNAVPLQAKNVTPNAAGQTVTPGSGYLGLSQVVLPAEANLVAGNIKRGVSIFGVNGSYAPSLQQKSVTPGASSQTVQPDSGYDGLSKVTVAGDADLIAANIKKGVNIFGVVGTYTGEAGSLIVCDCPATTTAVTATYGGTTINAALVGTIAYVSIPYTYTGVVTITATYTLGGQTLVGSTTVTITAPDKYTCSIEAAVTVYSNGSWNTALIGSIPTCTIVGNASGTSPSYTDGSSSLVFNANNSSCSFILSPALPTSGFSYIRIVLSDLHKDPVYGGGASICAFRSGQSASNPYGSVRATTSGVFECPLNGASSAYFGISLTTYMAATITKIELV